MKALLPFVLFLLSACSARGPLYREPSPPKPGMATVVLFRPGHLVDAAHVHRYFVNRIWTASLRSGGYTSFEVRAGEEQVFGVGREDNDVFILKPDAGRTY
jgi:hypothetical protein